MEKGRNMQEETKEREIKNCLHCRATLLCHEFIFFDNVDDPFAPDMMRGAHVSFRMQKAIKEGAPYALYTVKIPKRKAAKFLEVMERLEQRMFLAGRSDYVEYSQMLFQRLDKIHNQKN